MNYKIIFLILLTSHNAYSQGENNWWHLSKNISIDFNSGTPQVSLSGGLTTGTEEVTSVSDAQGNLLFYSDGIEVFNKDHIVMPNGRNMAGDFSAAQGVAATKVIDTDSLYYLFTLTNVSPNSRATLSYSIIDLSKDNGLGIVIPTQKTLK